MPSDLNSTQALISSRLYLTDPYKRSFSSRVKERMLENGSHYVILEQSAFYPTGGGQPFDTGTLNGVKVLDVTVRGDGSVVHRVEREITDDVVDGELDWERRHEHMCLHTGQHVLSQAFRAKLGIGTVSFHLGEETVTIDLDRKGVSQSEILEAECEANRVVRECRTVKAWFPTADEMEGLSIRKLSEKASESVRLVEIADFDRCGCGGTHVTSTGEVQMIKVLGAEIKNGLTRIHFTAGPRALRDYAKKHAIVATLTSTFSLTQDEIVPSVQKYQETIKRGQKELENAKRAIAEYRGKELFERATPVRVGSSELRFVREVLDVSKDDPRTLVHSLVVHPDVLAILITPGDAGTVVIGSSCEVKAKAVLQELFSVLGAGKGGGNDKIAQGSLPLGELEVKKILDKSFF